MPVSTAMRPETVLPAFAAASLMAFALTESQTTGVMSYSTMVSAYMSGVSPSMMISSFAPASLRVIASCRVAMAKVFTPFCLSTSAHMTLPWP